MIFGVPRQHWFRSDIDDFPEKIEVDGVTLVREKSSVSYHVRYREERSWLTFFYQRDFRKIQFPEEVPKGFVKKTVRELRRLDRELQRGVRLRRAKEAEALRQRYQKVVKRRPQ
jgi:hypothetical protein